MAYFINMIIGIFIGFILGAVYMFNRDNFETALKISNVMNASMLDCVTKQVITKKQVHDIETIFHKHIEANFEHMKASHDDNHDNCKNKRIKIETNYLKTI